MGTCGAAGALRGIRTLGSLHPSAEDGAWIMNQQIKRNRDGVSMVRILRSCVALVLVMSACSLFAQQTEDEEAVWKLEHKYWENVKALDLVS